MFFQNSVTRSAIVFENIFQKNNFVLFCLLPFFSDCNSHSLPGSSLLFLLYFIAFSVFSLRLPHQLSATFSFFLNILVSIWNRSYQLAAMKWLKGLEFFSPLRVIYSPCSFFNSIFSSLKLVPDLFYFISSVGFSLVFVNWFLICPAFFICFCVAGLSFGFHIGFWILKCMTSSMT